jgi:hypothetical protein
MAPQWVQKWDFPKGKWGCKWGQTMAHCLVHLMVDQRAGRMVLQTVQWVEKWAHQPEQKLAHRSVYLMVDSTDVQMAVLWGQQIDSKAV